MKKLLLSLLFFNFLYSTSAQIEFAPPGATWHYGDVDYAFGSGVLHSGYQKWTYQGDSIFMGKNCKVLTGQRVIQIDGEVEIDDLPERIIYQDSFKVYSWFKDRFYKMYDFGVEEGDTVTLAGGNNYNGSCSITFQVDSVYFEPINGVNLKNLFISPIPGGEGATYGHINEKLGALPNFLFVSDIGCLLDVPRPFPFRCYEDDNFLLYQADTTSCEYYKNVSATTTLAELGMTINPNPIHDFFEIQNEEGVSYDLSIIDLTGNVVYQIQQNSSTRQTIFTDNWNPGMYIVVVQTQNKLVSKKLLKLSQ